jgi:hypothetical protein
MAYPGSTGRGVQGVSFALQSVVQTDRQPEPKDPPDDLNFVRTAVPNSSKTVNGRSNVALLSMPSVVAVDQQTSANLETTLGSETSGQLFKVGDGQLVSLNGSKQSVELYSHLTNDTVITSVAIILKSPAARKCTCVGVNRK